MRKPRLIKYLETRYATSKSKRKARFALYECPYCGKEFEANAGNVKQGFIKSCGCLNKKLREERNYKHGLSKLPLFKKYKSMISRCHNPNDFGYEYYGAIGISVCEEWRNDFYAFEKWSLENGYSPELEIDRIDNSLGYFPENCHYTQILPNRQNTRLIYTNNTSGFRGVHYCNKIKKWVSQINNNNKNHKLGSYANILDAARAYNKFVIENKTAHPLNPIPDEDE